MIPASWGPLASLTADFPTWVQLLSSPVSNAPSAAKQAQDPLLASRFQSTLASSSLLTSLLGPSCVATSDYTYLTPLAEGSPRNYVLDI